MNQEQLELALHAAQQRIAELEAIQQPAYRIIDATGQIVSVTSYGHTECDANGKPLVATGVSQDITECKRAEERIDRYSHELQIILDTVTVGVCRLKNRRVEWANIAFDQMFGYAAGETHGMETSILYPDQASFEQLGQAAYPILVTGEQYSSEMEMKKQDGTLFWCRLIGKMISPEEGSIWMLENVTEHKLAENALIASEKKLKSLLESLQKSRARLEEAQRLAHIGNWEWDIDTQTLTWSDEVYRIFGLNPAEFTLSAEAIEAAIHPDDRTDFLRQRQSLLDEKKYADIDHRIVLPNGEVRHVQERAQLVLDEQGDVVKVIGTVQDITERKQAETQNRKLSQVVEQSPATVVITGLDGSIEYVNPQFCRITGYSVQEAMGQNPRILKTEYTSSEEYKLLWDTITAGEVWRGEFLNKKKNGDMYWESATIAPIFDTKGKIVNFLAVKEDITNRKQAEQALRESEQKYRDLLNGMNDTVWVIDNTMRILDVNNAATTVLGYTREEFLAMRIPDIDDALATKEIQNLVDTMPQDTFQVFETWHTTKNGRKIPVEISSSLVSYMGKTVIISIARDITERKQAQQKLHESETRYQQFISLAFEGISRTEFDQPIDTSLPVEEQIDLIYEYAYMAECNRALAEMYHTTVETMIGARLIDVHQSKDNPINREAFRKFIAGGYQSVDNETLEFTVDGKPIWFISNTIGVVQDGKLVRIWETAMDITERKRAQEELHDLNRTLEERVKERASQVQDLYDNAPVGYHSLDAEGRFIAINQTELNWLGYEREELLGKPITSIFTSQTAEVFPELFAQFKISGQVSNQEAEVVCKDGTSFPVMINTTAIYDEYGQYISSRSSMTDITKRKQAENEIKRNVNFTNALLNAIPTPVFYKDKDGLYQGCNLAFAEVMGKNPIQIKGKTVYELWPDVNAKIYHQKDLELMQNGNRQVYESVVTDKDGNVSPVIFIKDIFYDESGGVAGLVGAFVDITERKRIEETLQRANAELQRTMRMKDEFLASMSHELRTPLNAILGLSQSLIEQFIGPLNDRQTHALQTIDTSGRHLLALINDILDLSKVSANQMTLELEPVLVRGLCDASLLFVRESAHKKYLQVTSVLDPAVEYMQADERRLKQILVNLLSNAVKFTPEGGAIELRVTGNIEKQAVSFSVSDTGIGIAPEHTERLFQPFVQLDSGLNRQFEGTGLGLSLVAHMTELHGGSVSVESEPGRGSTFTVTLPWGSARPSPAVTEDRPEPPALALAKVFPPGSTIPLILIAEDNEANITMLSTYLQTRGYRFAVARNGEEALNYAHSTRPDLILMDLQMPVLDGLEATRRLRRESDPQIATIPVLALTALAMPADRRRAMEAGANEYLSKPVDLRQLTEIIDRLTEEQ